MFYSASDIETEITIENAKEYKGKCELSEELNIRIFDAYLKYYLRIQEPEKLTDEDWAIELQNLTYIRQQEKKASEVK